MKIRSPTAAAACLHLRVSSTEASPPAASALYLPVLGVVTTDFVSHHTPAAVSKTETKKKNVTTLRRDNRILQSAAGKA